MVVRETIERSEMNPGAPMLYGFAASHVSAETSSAA